METSRLFIRKFVKEDAEDLYEYLSDAEVLKFEPYKPLSMEEAKKEAERRCEDENFYAVCLKNGKLIGNIYISNGNFETWEIGFVFNKSYWKKGYAYESVKELINYVFEKKKAWRVVAMCDPLNENSWRLLEKLGFRREGFLRKNIYFFKDSLNNPIWKDTYEYGILREEWKN